MGPAGYCERSNNQEPGGESQKIDVEGAPAQARLARPCRWIFESEPERYAGHKDVVKKILAGEAPANLLALTRNLFGLTQDRWGKDVRSGDYPWLAAEGAG